MITVEDIQKYLEVSPTYAQKLIDDANGDEDKAYKTFIRKLNEKTQDLQLWRLCNGCYRRR